MRAIMPADALASIVDFFGGKVRSQERIGACSKASNSISGQEMWYEDIGKGATGKTRGSTYDIMLLFRCCHRV